MRNLLLFLQIVFSVILITTILLHSAKGEGMGSIGGVARIFGTQKGLEEGLDRITALSAIFFLVISIALAITG